MFLGCYAKTTIYFTGNADTFDGNDMRLDLLLDLLRFFIDDDSELFAECLLVSFDVGIAVVFLDSALNL